MSINQKVIEVISKFGMLNYLESLAAAQTKKIDLYTVFPITSAPNWSEKREVVLVENFLPLVNLMGRKNSLN
ncbi:MAG: hypothetical protein HQ564_04010 [Candidatus Saganbacteria bacterium]|nr:hypothetical protein [Candidatus Saganbacteria bacterium]